MQIVEYRNDKQRVYRRDFRDTPREEWSLPDRTEWYNNGGDLHREDGPAVQFVNGDNEWYLNGLRHREDGPAIECPDGHQEWYRHGKLHREDGPALVYSDGHSEWYVDGVESDDPLS